MQKKMLWFPSVLLVAGCQVGAPGSGTLPYIVRFESGTSTTEAIDVAAWEADGVVALPGTVGPRSWMRVVFSERMETPLDVGGPALIWLSTVESVSWIDEVDGTTERDVTVLTGILPSGFEPDTAYALTFDGLADEPVRDEDRDPLTIRFGGNGAASAVERLEPRTDVRSFVTAPVRIDRIDDTGVRGVVTARVASVRISIGSPGATSPPAGAVVAESVSGADAFHLDEAGTCGDVVFAEAFDANGVSLGWDALPNWDCEDS